MTGAALDFRILGLSLLIARRGLIVGRLRLIIERLRLIIRRLSLIGQVSLIGRIGLSGRRRQIGRLEPGSTVRERARADRHRNWGRLVAVVNTQRASPQLDRHVAIGDCFPEQAE